MFCVWVSIIFHRIRIVKYYKAGGYALYSLSLNAYWITASVRKMTYQTLTAREIFFNKYVEWTHIPRYTNNLPKRASYLKPGPVTYISLTAPSPELPWAAKCIQASVSPNDLPNKLKTGLSSTWWQAVFNRRHTKGQKASTKKGHGADLKGNTPSVWWCQKGFLFEFTDSWWKEVYFFSVRGKKLNEFFE